MIHKLILFFCLLTAGNLYSQDWETWYEKSAFLETAGYERTIEYCKQLSDFSPWVEYVNFGKSPQGNDMPYLIIDKGGRFTLDAVKASGNAILLVQAGIHPGESEGTDAGMMLARDLVINKKYAHLLDHVTVLFIPVFNVDGYLRFGPFNRINQNGPKEMGWRCTANNLNLNRDFVKAKTPEMQDWLRFFNLWLPDFFIDCHTTDGADYQYILTYALETKGNMDENLTKWQKDKYLPYLEEKMNSNQMPIFPYVSFRNWHDPRSGLYESVSPPMISQGYTAIQNRPGLLIETHMLKPYKPRVESTYEMIRFTMEVLNRDYYYLKKINLLADKWVSSADFRSSKFAVKYTTSMTDSVLVEFKGVEYDIETSDFTSGPWFKYYKDKPKNYLLPLFGQCDASEEVKLPEAYVIPPEWSEVIDHLLIHGVELKRLKTDVVIDVESYKFSNCSWNATPNEGCQMLSKFDIEEIEEERLFPEGSVVVDMNQRRARLIAHILEPKAQDSYISWGFFNSIFEQKEYGESYVMETEARKMMIEHPELEREFEAYMKLNPQMRGQQWPMLNWWYQKSLWKDAKMNVYPVGKIYKSKVLNKLPLK
ncbi:MAG: M14 family metallopeptidase [Bacteroidales bacterium]|nr:M14 family metallopeptidase [Bacteroidales bacterium]